jgi:hypothetical protein
MVVARHDANTFKPAEVRVLAQAGRAQKSA